MSRIIIGVDEHEGSQDAVAFGLGLARDSGAAVTVAHAYPRQPHGFAGAYEADRFQERQHLGSAGLYGAEGYLLEESAKLVERVSEPLRGLPGLELRSLSEPSAARGLHELAEELEAGLIVIGSSHAGRVERVVTGSTAERLLHGSPCPVAIVPHGYRNVERHGSRVIACGWDGGPESDAALAAAEELARGTAASLRVIWAFEPPSHFAYPQELSADYAESIQGARDHAKRSLELRVAQLATGIEAEGEVFEAPAAHTLVEVSDAVDLMVLGSRGYGPLKAVLLGGVSGKVVAKAACPVIVVPKGFRRGMASVFDASAEAMS